MLLHIWSTEVSALHFTSAVEHISKSVHAIVTEFKSEILSRSRKGLTCAMELYAYQLFCSADQADPLIEVAGIGRNTLLLTVKGFQQWVFRHSDCFSNLCWGLSQLRHHTWSKC